MTYIYNQLRNETTKDNPFELFYGKQIYESIPDGRIKELYDGSPEELDGVDESIREGEPEIALGETTFNEPVVSVSNDEPPEIESRTAQKEPRLL